MYLYNNIQNDIKVRKFSLVQIFTDLPFRPSEEIFVVLNFAPVLDLVLANACEDIFCCFISQQPNYLQKPQKFAPCENFPPYNTLHEQFFL